MGYKRTAKKYELVFDQDSGDFAGLELTLKGLSIGKYLKIAELAESASDGQGDLGPLFTAFADALISWNLEDDNGPVPATFEGVQEQELDFVMTLITKWLTSVAGVSAPLERDSDAGATSLEASMQMANL